jgi:hypothetical protein
MTGLSKQNADEINRLHDIASQTANSAIEMAKQIGLLLLAVKDDLGHGEFGAWVEAHLSVSMRQAQRYMAAAQGKPITVRHFSSKYDTVSHLDEEEPGGQETISDEEFDAMLNDWRNPVWTPMPGHRYVCSDETGAYWVVPSKRDRAAFHITRFYHTALDIENSVEDGTGQMFTHHPEPALHVSFRLKHFGLLQPEKAQWQISKNSGLDAPFGDFAEPDERMRRDKVA